MITAHSGLCVGLQLVIEGVDNRDGRVGILWVFLGAIFQHVAY